MDKLKLWLIPGLIVIIAIAGLFFLRDRIPEIEISNVVVNVETSEETNKPKGFAKPVEPSLQEKSANDSSSMADALRSGNINDCDEITWDKELKQKCIDNLIYAASIHSNDETECKKIQNDILKQQCYNKVYLNVAVDEQSLEICDNISDAVIKKLCNSQVHALLARNSSDINSCNEIDSGYLRDNCQDNYYLKSSAESHDDNTCNNIKDPNSKQQCIETVKNNIAVIEANKIAIKNRSNRTTQDLMDICNSLSGDRAIKCKDMVYPKLAMEEKDISYCDKISDSILASKCKEQNNQNIDQYFIRQAIASNDISFCEKISSEIIQTTCKNSI